MSSSTRHASHAAWPLRHHHLPSFGQTLCAGPSTTGARCSRPTGIHSRSPRSLPLRSGRTLLDAYTPSPLKHTLAPATHISSPSRHVPDTAPAILGRSRPPREAKNTQVLVRRRGALPSQDGYVPRSTARCIDRVREWDLPMPRLSSPGRAQ
ncbi:hypothetical protein FKP32DRAFT_364606 [Trametes sanguinea]|nr:hypothetical protein FKP32DRAFT_364606 [Trametes sanguinea]